jgi:hypothetical protein
MVRQCGEMLNDISAVGLYWFPGHVGVRGNETADELAWNGSTSGFVGPEPALRSLGRILGIRLVAGWGTSTEDDGRTLAIPNDRLEN